MLFVAAYVENTILHRYVDAEGSSVSTATLEMCQNFLQTSAKVKTAERSCICLSNLCFVEMAINSSVNNPCSVKGNINRFHNH
jgi:hypothetical protein